MVRTIQPAPFPVAELIPELSGLARQTTLLYPRSGAPQAQDSSIGGPLLWPADEPWPLCADPGHVPLLGRPAEGVDPEPVAMLPVVQLHARDVPELPFPAGRDLLQIVWCPLIHDSGGQVTAMPRLYWRRAAEVVATGVLPEPPVPYEYEYESDFVPRACTVSPTRVEEYPNWDMPDDLAQSLGDRFAVIEAEFGSSFFELATIEQSKVGGYPAWSQAPDWPDCACGLRMEHLLSITAMEPHSGRWLPLDEQGGGASTPLWRIEADPTVQDVIGHGMDLGDLGGMYFFVCPTCPATPWAYRYDC